MKTAKKSKRVTPTHGDLRVWWIPQVPMKSFVRPVASLVEAKLLLDTLADYDLFQLANNIKPDYANAGGLSMFDAIEGDWVDWCDDDTGNEIGSLTLEEWRAFEEAKKLGEVQS